MLTDQYPERPSPSSAPSSAPFRYQFEEAPTLPCPVHPPVSLEAAAALAVVAVRLLIVDTGGIRMAVLQYGAVGARVRRAHTAICRVSREAGALVPAARGAVRAERVLAAVVVAATLRQSGRLWNGHQ